MKKYKLAIDIFGWIGMVLILVAYGLITLKMVDSSSVNYQLMNAAGSIGLIANALFYKAYPLFILNVILELIALYGLYTSLF